MRNVKLPIAVLLALQVLAVILYPLSYFRLAPQAAVLPPALLFLLALAVVGLNTNVLSIAGTRNLLIFVQGLNTVVRLMTLLPNLKTPAGEWAWGLMVAQVIAMGLSWYSMGALEHRPLNELRFRKTIDANG
ncbi:MAG: hypothetical protein MUF84_11810 [Anaerolineae bacterium]|nr:hypothetical protein [Anaerolineae bacterium]